MVLLVVGFEMVEACMRRILVVALVLGGITGPLMAQPPKRKSSRAKPPTFDSKAMEGVFFADVKKQLQGEPPKASDAKGSSSARPSANPNSTMASEATGGSPWPKLISAPSIEDLIKESKLRLDSVVTTETKFAGGGFKDARREYTLLAMMFGIIEQYPTEVRWKKVSPWVRMKMVRVALSSKVGSSQAYNEAKQRKQDLTDLVSGSAANDNSPLDELDWGNAIDRVPLMQVMDWGTRENLIKLCATPKTFQESPEEVMKYAELIASSGELLMQKGMTDAGDPEYDKHAIAMRDQALAIVQAVKLNSPDAAREAAALINQACDNCHNSYR